MPRCYKCKRPCNHGDLWGSLVPIVSAETAVSTDWKNVKRNLDPSRNKKRYWYLCERCSTRYRAWLETITCRDGEHLDLSIQGWILHQEAREE
jgi:hypothetical protein